MRILVSIGVGKCMQKTSKEKNNDNDEHKWVALTAAADQNLIRLATRQLLDELERYSTLSRHDVRVVKGMHERGARL